MSWSGGIAEWIEGDTAFISVAFSWKLDEAFQRAIWYKEAGYSVRVGGGGLFLRKNYFDGIADTRGDVEALIHHNPQATIASRGCPVGCYFCIVPKMEGKDFVLLAEFTPRPILCDNNVSRLPEFYQDHIIDKYIKTNTPLTDINSGFEPLTFTEETYQRWKKIYKGYWRFAYDETKEGEDVYKMSRILKDEPAGKKRVYVLIGNEPFEDCYSRILKVIEWGCEPFAQPMIALNALQKKPLVRFDWTEQKLKDLARWTNRWIWRTVKFSDYRPSAGY
jgi:hypothetical protein